MMLGTCRCLPRRIRLHPGLTRTLHRETSSSSKAASGARSVRQTAGKQTFAFPARYVAYHAGTGRTTFLACLKVTTVLTLVFYGAVVTPSVYKAGEPWWKVGGAALCGLIPFCFIAYVTAPFVTFVRISLPDFARQSKEILRRFARNPPSNTRLEITTISLVGKPRVSSMTISDLRPANQRFGLVNYTRDTKLPNVQRKWYMYPAVGKFFIQKRPGKDAQDSVIWEDIAATISKRNKQS